MIRGPRIRGKAKTRKAPKVKGSGIPYLFYLVLRRDDGVEYLWPATLVEIEGQPQMKELHVSRRGEPVILRQGAALNVEVEGQVVKTAGRRK